MAIERTQYELVAECILSGQVSDREISDLTDTDPKFGEWFRAQTSKRPSVTASAPEEVDLISLAAWLHRQSKEAETAVAAVPGQHGKRRIREDAARLAQASAIVKEAADRKREQRAEVAPRPVAANQP